MWAQETGVKEYQTNTRVKRNIWSPEIWTAGCIFTISKQNCEAGVIISERQKQPIEGGRFTLIEEKDYFIFFSVAHSEARRNRGSWDHCPSPHASSTGSCTWQSSTGCVSAGCHCSFSKPPGHIPFSETLPLGSQFSWEPLKTNKEIEFAVIFTMSVQTVINSMHHILQRATMFTVKRVKTNICWWGLLC